MDHRIEVVNENMVVVDFTLLPLDGINYVPDPMIPTEEDPARIADDGMLVLNSKYKGFKLLKDGLLALIPLSNKKLLQWQIKLLKRGSDMDKLNIEFIKIELERREKKRAYDHESKH